MDCANGFGNTGYLLSCDANFKVMRGIIVLKTYADDGTENKIAAATALTPSYLTSRLNDPDPSKRWYPIQGLKAIASERGEDVYYDNDDGSREFVRAGVRNVSFEIRQLGAEFLGKIQACTCDQLSFFMLDEDGKLRGIIKQNGNGDLYPIKMQPSTFSSNLVFATADKPEGLTVAFQFGLNEKDYLLRVYDDQYVTADLSSAMGLLDVYLTVSNVTTTGFRAELTTSYSRSGKGNASGLVAGDFALYNVTTAAAIAITSVTETGIGTGIYDFVIATTPTASIKRLTPTKNRYDFTPVVAATFTTGA